MKTIREDWGVDSTREIMPADAAVAPNVKQAVPFFNVTDIEASLRFYVDGRGFVPANQ